MLLIKMLGVISTDSMKEGAVVNLTLCMLR
jgi:hypothetical protein